jgi:hypothetical protein
MRQLKFIALAGVLTLSMSACSPGEDTASTPAASPSSSATAAPGGKAQTFNKPIVEADKKKLDKSTKLANVPSVPGLLKSTNPDERAKQVQSEITGAKGRPDPFKGLSGEVVRVKLPTLAGSGQVPPKPTITLSPNRGGSGGSGRVIMPGSIAARPPMPSSPFPRASGGGGRPTVKPGNLPGGGKAGGKPITPPAPPSTDLAESVEVSGVVRVGRGVQVIVKAPNEATSRYVQVGQRLSNGQVLIKRVEMPAGSDPVVVLEQNGVEVSRIVGQQPVAARDKMPAPPTAPAGGTTPQPPTS